MTISDLSVCIIEDNRSSRSLLKDMLRSHGVSRIDDYENGEQFLAALEHAPDLILLGYDLGGAFKGTDLIRYCSHNQLLPDWVQVAFISNNTETALTDLPQRLCPVSVYQKPISSQQLSQLLTDTRRLLSKTVPVIRVAQQTPNQSLVDKLASIHSEELRQPLKDVVMSVQANVLLKAGHGELAWDYAEALENSDSRHELKLSIAYQQGEKTTLTALLEELAQQERLRQKQLFYRLRLQSQAGDYTTMLDTFEQWRDVGLLPNQLMLKSLLLYLRDGYEDASSYLENKLKQRQDDAYYQNLLLCWQMTIALLECHKADSPQCVLGHLQSLKKQIQWQAASAIFQRYERLMALAVLSVSLYHDGGDHEAAPTFQELEHGLPVVNVFECTTLAYTYIHLNKTDKAREMLLEADRFIARMQTSPERLAASLLNRQLLMMLYQDNKRIALEYNRWGLQYSKAKLPYRALAMFAQAQRNYPGLAGFTLNLLSTLKQLQQDDFWELNYQELTEQLSQMPLSDNEQQRLACLVQ